MDFSGICCKSVLCPECPFKMGNYRRNKVCYNGKSRKKLTSGKHQRIVTLREEKI